MRRGELVSVETKDGMNDYLGVIESVHWILEACTIGLILHPRTAAGLLELSVDEDPIPYGLIKKVIRKPSEIMAALGIKAVEAKRFGELLLSPADWLFTYDPAADETYSCAKCQRPTAHALTHEKSPEELLGFRWYQPCCLTKLDCYQTLTTRFLEQFERVKRGG